MTRREGEFPKSCLGCKHEGAECFNNTPANSYVPQLERFKNHFSVLISSLEKNKHCLPKHCFYSNLTIRCFLHGIQSSLNASIECGM